jgi:mannose-6-phosphate isomerase-like protein (cupin superfamily)
MTLDWRSVPPDGGTRYEWANDAVRVTTPTSFTDGALNVVEDTLKPGFHLARHHHKRMTEIFYVLDGEVSFVFDDRRVDAMHGMAVNIAPGEHHEVFTESGGRLITIFAPGGFDLYLAEVAEIVAAGQDDDASMTRLGHKYDIWPDD